MNNENLIKAMRETMRRQSQVITSLHQQIESLEGKTAQAQPTTPKREWVVLTGEQFVEAVRLAEAGNYLVAFQRIQQWLKEKNT